jgi:SAM-dependent methyltransferase
MDPEALFWRLHSDLPREGVGSDATTRTLFAMAQPLPRHARTLDVGCGPGRSTLALAAAGARVVAVDTHEPFLRRLRRAAADQGLADRITVHQASMGALPFADAAFDAVWSEGAAYLLGVDEALRRWRRLLAPGGALVVTDVGWATPTPAPASRAFWAEYPAMRDPAATVAAAEAAGYDVVGTYRLPESDWWAEYYDPLAARIDALEAELGTDPQVRAALTEHRAEIDLRRLHAGDYDYTGYVLRRRA